KMTVLMVIVHEHCENALVLLDKKRRCAVRQFFQNTRHREANSANPLELRFTALPAGALPLLTHCQLLRAELGDPFDQLDRDVRSERKPDCGFAELVGCKFVLECRDDSIAGRIKRVVLLPSGEKQHRNAIQFVHGNLIRDHFLGCRHGLADGAAHAPESDPHVLGLRSNVLVHGLEVCFRHRDSASSSSFIKASAAVLLRTSYHYLAALASAIASLWSATFSAGTNKPPCRLRQFCVPQRGVSINTDSAAR